MKGTGSILRQPRSDRMKKANIISINGQYPGPTIRAREGDTVVVQLENLMSTENVVIHWHGIRQIGTLWDDGTPSISQCAISFNMEYAAGKEPFTCDGELRIVLNDWGHKSTYEQAVGLSSNPFRWVGEPERDEDNTTVQQQLKIHAMLQTPQCSPLVLLVRSGNTYRLCIASVASLSSLNFLIQGQKMTVVEADGHYVETVEVDNLDVYSGESYSVLITANQDPSQNYRAGLNVRGRPPKTPTGLAILNYHITHRNISQVSKHKNKRREEPCWRAT
ncbi:hypothetical protein SUGI_1088680 [Cryptomeria japonica]|nr:hypothetical protein SUGI_1088680 [Cryptomeria japonica]